MPLPRSYPAKYEDPELAAERQLELISCLEKGLPPPKKTAKNCVAERPQPIAGLKEGTNGSHTEGSNNDTKGDDATKTTLCSKGSFKEKKANRKKRCRGVSGSSIKKDGGRFDMGLENTDNYDRFSESETEDFEDCERYIRRNYSSRSSNGIGTDEEASNDSNSNGASRRIEEVSEALLSSVSDPGVDGQSALAELLLEEYDDSGRVKLIHSGIQNIVKDLCGTVVLEMQSEFQLACIIARLLDDGLLNSSSVISFVENSTADYASVLLRVAYNMVQDGSIDYKKDTGKAPPERLVTLARELCQESEAQDIAIDLASLNVPYFHSQFVYLACVEAINTMNMDVIYFVTGAFRDMIDHDILRVECVRVGLARFFDNIDSLEIDLPSATSLANLICSYATNEFELLDKVVYSRCPKPKRFLMKRANSCGKLEVHDGADDECNAENYFIYKE